MICLISDLFSKVMCMQVLQTSAKENQHFEEKNICQLSTLLK